MRGPEHPRQFTEDFRRRIVALVDSGKPRAEAVRAACGAGAAAPAPVLAALAVAWTAAAAALAARGCRRFARELAAERDRLA